MANVRRLAFDAIVVAYTAIALAEFVPWALSFGPSPLAAGINDTVFRFFSLFCHQLPWRSLYLNGVPMPVCARCAAIYAATALGLIALRTGGYGDREFGMCWPLLAILLAPAGIDGGTQLAGWRESTNALRLATGIPYGIAYAYLLAWAVPFVYALLELASAGLARDASKVEGTMGRIRHMAWPGLGYCLRGAGLVRALMKKRA